jgi:hypothetical protein
LAVCLIILFLLVVLRNTQPVSSRFIAPFIGISAIIIDSVLNGIIRNALLLGLDTSDDTKTINILSYVIMLTANPLMILAMVIYLWQHIRYILLQNIYSLMAGRDPKFAQIHRVFRLFTSKILYTIIAIVFTIVTLVFFTIFVIIAEVFKIDTRRKNTIIAEVVVFGSLVLFLGAMIFIALVTDIILALKRLNTKDSKQTSTFDDQKQHRSNPILALLFSDPLLFRIDAVLILVFIIILLALYPIGIVSIVTKSEPYSSLMIARVVLEIVFMVAKIIAFGGFVAIVGVKNWFVVTVHKRRNKKDSHDLNDESLQSYLRDPQGYNAFYL